MYYIVRPRDPLQSIENKAFPKLSFGFKAFYAYPISPSLLSQYLLYIVLFSRAAPLEVKKKGDKNIDQYNNKTHLYIIITL